MSTHRVLLPQQLPVLTEIIELPPLAPPPPERPADVAGADGEGEPRVQQEEIVHRVMRELELQIDLQLETRLREILAPAIARATDQLMRETREDLAALLGEILSRTVVQELSRTRAE